MTPTTRSSQQSVLAARELLSKPVRNKADDNPGDETDGALSFNALAVDVYDYPPPPALYVLQAQKPSASAALSTKSYHSAPDRMDPRSTMVTTMERLLRGIFTRTLVPNGRVRWAATMAPEL